MCEYKLFESRSCSIFLSEGRDQHYDWLVNKLDGSKRNGKVTFTGVERSVSSVLGGLSSRTPPSKVSLSLWEKMETLVKEWFIRFLVDVLLVDPSNNFYYKSNFHLDSLTVIYGFYPTVLQKFVVLFYRQSTLNS